MFDHQVSDVSYLHDVMQIGSLPPNSRNGQSFINDPTITDTTEVKANIKLRFRNKAGDLIWVSLVLDMMLTSFKVFHALSHDHCNY
jgi:hypothetical protein